MLFPAATAVPYTCSGSPVINVKVRGIKEVAHSIKKSSVELKNGAASYLDATGPTDVLAAKLIGIRVYAVESYVDDTKTYPANSCKDWSDVSDDSNDWFLVVNSSKDLLTNAPAYARNATS